MGVIRDKIFPLFSVSIRGGGYSRGSKLLKDDKSVIEELTTARNEFKKVNRFLIDEIESLKNENVFLKSELSKYLLSMSGISNSVKNDELNNSKERSLDLTKYIDSDSNDQSDDETSDSLPPFEFTVDS